MDIRVVPGELLTVEPIMDADRTTGFKYWIRCGRCQRRFSQYEDEFLPHTAECPYCNCTNDLNE